MTKKITFMSGHTVKTINVNGRILVTSTHDNKFKNEHKNNTKYSHFFGNCRQ